MRAERHVGCVMNEGRKHQAGCAADESMYVHSAQRRNVQSKDFLQSAALTLVPPRPRSYGDVGLTSRGSERPGLQVQGFCCPLQQRPSSGRVTRRVTPQSRGGGDGGLTLLSSLKGRLGSRAKPASRSVTGSGPEATPERGAPTVGRHTDPASETADAPAAPRDIEVQARGGQVPELHLYLPSSHCDNEEQGSVTEEMRTSAEENSAQGSEVKPNNANPPASPNPSLASLDQPDTGPGTPRHTF